MYAVEAQAMDVVFLSMSLVPITLVRDLTSRSGRFIIFVGPYFALGV